MIRVNLLPVKQARRRSAGRTQLFVFGGLLLLMVMVFGLLWLLASSELSRVQKDVANLEQGVKAAKEEVKDAEELKKQKKDLEDQLGVLDKLEASRTGPVKVLDEFQGVLSPPRNEEDRFAQLAKEWNVDWDPRRVWVDTLIEKDGKFTLTGGAVDTIDVAEFLQRLISADHFDKVELKFVQSESSKDGPRYVKYELNGDVLYAPKPKVEEAAPATPKGKKTKTPAKKKG